MEDLLFNAPNDIKSTSNTFFHSVNNITNLIILANHVLPTRNTLGPPAYTTEEYQSIFPFSNIFFSYTRLNSYTQRPARLT